MQDLPPSAKRSFEDISYDAHSKEWAGHVLAGAISARASAWYRSDTVGAWIQERLRRMLLPLIAAYPASRWLTIGDGAGTDARFLLEHGLDALATDISTQLLAAAFQAKYIKAYALENAEKLSFANDSFDFAHCKEAYHHFPRPYLALYEMLRVAKHGVVLIEPFDPWIGSSTVARKLFIGIRRLLGQRTEKHGYEQVGNYQYTLSVREMEKVAVGMNFPVIAYLPMNSFYRPGVETAPVVGNGPGSLFHRAQAVLALKNMLSRFGLIPYGLLILVIFKRLPDENSLTLLKKSGFSIERLPANPYLDAQ